eukprot:Hpha_TRINITY_DN15590_c8_g1::TRINITY_DN15590_c8_g1_i1::g.106353::m.106353
MGGCCRWGWLVRRDDTPAEAIIKTKGFPFVLFLLPVYATVLARQLAGANQMVNVMGYATNAIGALVFVGGILWNGIPAGYILDQFLMLSTVGVCLMDMGNTTVSYSFRAWTMVVLVLDG